MTTILDKISSFQVNYDTREKTYAIFSLTSQTIIWGIDMEKYDSSHFYYLGISLGQVLEALDAPDATILTIKGTVNYASARLEFFTNNNPNLPLSVQSSKEIITNITSLLQSNDEDSKSSSFLKNNKFKLSLSIWDFQAVLSKEVPQINIYLVTPHRAYDMTILINKGENLLSPHTVELLNNSKKEVINDIREAARCLAFGFSTAVGFHLYRAIEAIIVKDYFPFLKVDATEYERNPNLGNYIRILKDKGVDDKIHVMLSHLKDHYRNPIMHPDEFWDLDKANSAIGPAISLIDVMVQDISDENKTNKLIQ